MSFCQRRKIFSPFPVDVRKVALVSLGSPPEKSSIRSFLVLMEMLGIECRVAESLFLPGLEPVTPGAVPDRAKDFAESWRDSSVDLIISSRGGYGSARLWESIDWKDLPHRKMPVLGYSDITAFHLAMLRCGRGVPVATPMGQDLPAACCSRRASESMRGAIERAFGHSVRGLDPVLEFPGGMIERRAMGNLWTLKPGRATGRLIPANLTVFASLVGTRLMPSLQGTIPLFEDVGEAPYRIARSLNQIRQAGILAKFAGIAFGSFKNCGSRSVLHDVFADFADSFDGPVACGIPFGHIRSTLSFVVGEKVAMCVE